MNELLNSIYNDLLNEKWEAKPINERFANMVEVLNNPERNKPQLDVLMRNRVHIEELINKIYLVLKQKDVSIKAFDKLVALVDGYYENFE